MSLGFRHDAVQWLAVDGAATEYTVGSLGFTPKAVRAYCMGIQSAIDAATTSLDIRASVGVAASASSRRSCGIYSQDAVTPSVTGVVASDDCIICIPDGAGARVGLLDIAFDADAVRFIVDDATPADLTVFVEIWGGSDITTVVIGDIAEPAATGNQDYTATGMVAAATDQMLFLVGCQSVSALNTAEVQDAGMCVGMAKSATTSEQCVYATNSDSGSAASDTDNYGLSDECLAQIVIGGGATVDARAAFVQWNADGFRLNWIARALTNRRSIFMAIKGGKWAVGKLTIDVSVVNNTTTVSGLAFQPEGLLILTGNGAEEVAGTSDTLGNLTMGSGSSISSRRWMSLRDGNGLTPTGAFICIQYDGIGGVVNNGAQTRTEQDIDVINSDGFRLIVDKADAADSVVWWDGWCAFASVPVTVYLMGAGLT